MNTQPGWLGLFLEDSGDRCRTAKLLARRSRVRIASILFGAKPIPLRGVGIEYLDFRDYVEGDDIRFVDWRITARSLTPEGDYRLIVKEFLAERMVNNTIILDYSGSMGYGDKLFSAIYVVSGFLWLADNLDDTIDLIVLWGDKTYNYPGIDPIQGVVLLEKHICRLEPRGYTSLRDVVSILKKLRKRRSLFIVSDYGHPLDELLFLGKNIYARNISLTMINITTPIEVEPPGTHGFYYFKDYERGEGLKTDIDTYYKAVKQHVLLYDTYSSKISYNVLRIKGLKDAIAKTPQIIRVYLGTRSRIHEFMV